MKITIEELPNSRIAYFRSIGKYGGRAQYKSMESFKKWLESNDVSSHSTILGIPKDNPEITPEDKCRYDVCVLIENESKVPKPAHIGELSGGTYAVFLLDHTKEAVNEFWSNVFSQIKRNNLLIKEQPIIERYTQQMIDNHLCEILVPIQ
ncbi:AraC family transcriptional regulator [Alkalicoccobacillus porphyridii]|uniref:Transcriptional regulator n=1 Tax=Alkalicoccobacillus porphyridii TaxID=2597270 RepID=A0A554A2W5_9BACI|nr:GyrI-like domain-containing protein [Alkalicoccobacillus porphyridii]TSB48032.1 transcriptional regulator [Alkalicoccobacillus porphyridii]